MEPTDLTIEILKSIRDEVRGTREDLSSRIDALREETGSRLDAINHRIVESEIRTSTAIVELAGTVRDMTGMLRAQAELRPRVERCERDIEELKRRTAG
jgi:hypothetical protein